MLNQYIGNYAEQGGVYYAYNYVANITFQKDLFLYNKAIKILENSPLENIYGGVFKLSGKNWHIVLVSFCEFTNNFAEYEGAIYFSLVSTQITDTASIFKSTYIFRKFHFLLF